MNTRYQLGLVRFICWTVTSSGHFLCLLLFIISHLLGLVSSSATFQEYSSCFSVVVFLNHIFMILHMLVICSIFTKWQCYLSNLCNTDPTGLCDVMLMELESSFLLSCIISVICDSWWAWSASPNHCCHTTNR